MRPRKFASTVILLVAVSSCYSNETPESGEQRVVEAEAVEKKEAESATKAKVHERDEVAEAVPVEASSAPGASTESGTKATRPPSADTFGREIDKATRSSESLREIFGKQETFEAKMDVTTSGDRGDLVVGRGAGGMGMRDSAPKGSAYGFGRVGGLGAVDTGGGRGVGGKIGRTVRRRGEPAPRVRNTESYKDHGVNEIVPTDEDVLSTFAVDVDTGSYTIARRKLRAGQMPPKDAVRVEEFINYFEYDYPEPKSGPFSVDMEAAPSPFHPDLNRKLLRIGVQGKRVTGAERKPVHLTFLVDVSGSMSGSDKLHLAQKSLELLTKNLQEGDSVAIATYAGRVAEILKPTGVEHRSHILGAIDGLRSGGSTAMNSGLDLAYKLALANFHESHVNRVIVLSDGDANVGPSSHEDILKRIEHFVDEGVTLSTIGFGMGNYKDTMMEQLANNGNGNYYYIDSMDEARKVFGEQLNGTLQVIAKDVKIQVEFNPDAVSGYRLVGYENRDIADEDFRDDKVDAGEIGAGHTVTALYEIVVKDNDEARLGTVRVRHKKPDAAKATEQAFSLTRADLQDNLSATSDDFQFAAAVASFAEILRESPYAKQLSYALVEELAQGAAGKRPNRVEFLSLVRNAKALR